MIPLTPRLEEYRERFLEYVAGFKHGNVEDVNLIALKRDHTLCVFDNAGEILATHPFSEEFVETTLLGALFHDVGRFIQYAQYKTFLDRESKNHGVLGATVLGSSLLNGAPVEQKRKVRAIVAMHNRKFTPRGISGELKQMTRVVRDADKIDILRVMTEHFTQEKVGKPVVVLHAEAHPTAYTPELYDAAWNAERGDYNKLRYENDFKLLLVGWVYDLRYAASYRLFKERALLEGVFGCLPETEAMEALKERMLAARDDLLVAYEAAEAGGIFGKKIPAKAGI